MTLYSHSQWKHLIALSKTSSYPFKQVHGCPDQALEGGVMEEIPCDLEVRGKEMQHQFPYPSTFNLPLKVTLIIKCVC